MLGDEAKVYKLVGPVLMAVEVEESRGNVDKRLEFIEAEIKKLDNGVAAKQGEQAELAEEIQKMQSNMKAETAKAVQEVIAA